MDLDANTMDMKLKPYLEWPRLFPEGRSAARGLYCANPISVYEGFRHYRKCSNIWDDDRVYCVDNKVDKINHPDYERTR